jgi:hypothetical protein
VLTRCLKYQCIPRRKGAPIEDDGRSVEGRIVGSNAFLYSRRDSLNEGEMDEHILKEIHSKQT